jgi:hypothetical protein
MERVFSLLAVLAAFSLAACGGGGGGNGGGGGVSGLSNPPMTMNLVMGGAVEGAAVADDLSNVSAGSKASLTQSGNSGMDIGDGFTLKPGSLVIEKGTDSVTFETGIGGVVSLYDNGYLGGMRSASAFAVNAVVASGFQDPPGHYADMVDGIAYDIDLTFPSEALVLNNTAMALEYSTFGFWAVSYNAKGLLDGAPADITGVWYKPIAGGIVTDHKAPLGNAVFTGKATALAHDPGEIDPPLNEFIFGTAALAVSGSADKVDLALVFPRFYDISYNNVPLNSSGTFYGGSVTVSENAAYGQNTTGFSMSGINHDPDLTYLMGQFYGNGANASEATGVFSVYDSKDNNITGAFGMK